MIYKNTNNIKTQTFINYIKKRIANNKHFLCSFLGDCGSGKSWAALRLVERLDPNFTLDNVVFKSSDFLKIIKADKLQKGSVIIFDEAGQGIGNRNWYSFINKSMVYLLQMYRFKNLITILTVPNVSFIDSGARKLMQAHISMKRVLKEQDLSIASPYLLPNIPDDDRDWKVFLRIHDNGCPVTIDEILFSKPSVILRHEYEKRKYDYFHNDFLKTIMGENGEAIKPIKLRAGTGILYRYAKNNNELLEKKTSEISLTTGLSRCQVTAAKNKLIELGIYDPIAKKFTDKNVTY